MPAYDSLRLRMCLCWFNPFMHASVMFRSRLMDGNMVRYDERYVTAQDYALWASLSLRGRVAVLPQMLMTHRERIGGVTGTRRQEQVKATAEISGWYTEKLTSGTALAGVTPKQLQTWVDEPAFPGPERIVAMRRFSRVAAANWYSSHETRASFLCWARPHLDRIAWRSLATDTPCRLLRSCGWSSLPYVMQRGMRSLCRSQS